MRALLCVFISLLIPQLVAQNSNSGGGKTARQGVRVVFNPGNKDGNGRVIATTPDRKAGEEEEPGLTEKGKADKALAEQHKGPRLTKPSPGPSGSQGMRRDSSQQMAFEGTTDTGFEPPDVAMAAGPNQIVAASNGVVNTLDKTGKLLGSQTFSAFFAPLSAYDTWFIYDPVVTYDSYLGRFWLTTAARNASPAGSVILIALSNASDPSPSGWTFWGLDFTYDGNNKTNNWCDYPHIGYDTQAIYVTCNQYSFPATPGVFQYAKIRLMAKTQFVSNACCVWYDHWGLREGNTSTLSFAIQPAAMRSAANSDGEFLVDAQGEGGTGGALQVWHFPDPINNPGQLDTGSTSVAAYGPAPSAQQPSSATGIDTGDARLLFANWQGGHLSTGQTSNCNSRACAEYYELDVSAFPNITVVNDWALQAAGVDFYYPSVDQNSNSDKVMVYSQSSSSLYAGSNFSGIPNSSSCTQCVDPPSILAAGMATYVRLDSNNRNRWGDYFSASPDPDGLGIWISGEFAQSLNSWATEISAIYNSYAPIDQLSTRSLDFGVQLINTTAQQAVSLTNIGNANLDVDHLSLSGSGYSETDNCTIAPIEPGHFCTVTVTFDPTVVQTFNGTLQIFTNSTTSPETISLTGAGSASVASISGVVSVSGGGGLSGVLMTLTGSQSGTVTTSATGVYSFSEPLGGKYTVTPGLSGYSFNPASFTVNNLSGNQVANFTATATSVTYTISGQATAWVCPGGGICPLQPLGSVAVVLSGSQTGGTTTAGSGIYSLTVSAGGTYTVTPSLSDYYFYPYPAALTFPNLSGNQTADFQAAVVNDFNHDGHPDVIWADPKSGFAQLWYLNGTQGVTLSTAANLTQANPWHIVAIADFDGNGTPDVVWQDPVSGAVQVWYLGGASGNVLMSAVNITNSNPWHVVSVADFNQDGHPDLLWQDPNSGFAQIWYLGGPQGITLLNSVDLDQTNPWHIVGCADFNGDGFPDVLWQDPVSGTVQIWYMQGSVFQSAVNLTTNPWKVVALADFNQDGHTDVVFQDPVSGAAQVFYYAGAQGTSYTGYAVLSGPNPWYIAGPH